MATVAENLATRKAAIAVELAAMSSSTSGGKPSYSINGQAVSHTEYRLSLYEEMAKLDALIAAAEGPYEEIGQAVP